MEFCDYQSWNFTLQNLAREKDMGISQDHLRKVFVVCWNRVLLSSLIMTIIGR